MSYQKVAQASDFLKTDKVRVTYNDQPVLIAKIKDKYFAVSDTCSHQKASLSKGEIIGESIECPWHGSRFDLNTGKAQALPAVFPLKKYDIKVEGDDVLINDAS